MICLIMPTQEIRKTIEMPSKTDALEPYRDWLFSVLNEYQYCQDDIFAIHLAVEEAFYNAVKHGNKLDASKNVTAEFVVNSDKVEITITDAGEGFDPDALPDCREGDNIYKADGRGIFLVRSYMDNVRFNEKGNSVHMVRNKRKAPKPSTA